MEAGDVLRSGFWNDEQPARDLSRQADARGPHLDDAGLAGPADAEHALVGQPECTQQRAIVDAELGRVKAGNAAGGELGQTDGSEA